MRGTDGGVECGERGVRRWIFYFYFYYFITGVPNSIRDYVFILQKSVLQKLGTEASKTTFQKLLLEKLQPNMDRCSHVILVATAIQLISFLGANSVERVAIDIAVEVVYPICEMVEKTSCL